MSYLSAGLHLERGVGGGGGVAKVWVKILWGGGGGGEGGCSKVCERRMTCPPCMEAAPKLNIIFYSRKPLNFKYE